MPEPVAVSWGAMTFRVAGGRHDAFWERFDAGTWEPSTLEAIAGLVDPAETFVDVGAWIGPTTLAAAAAGASVLAYEPDPSAYRQLVENVALNPDLAPRITTEELALGAHAGVGALGARSEGFGKSTSSLRPGEPVAETVPVPVVDAADAARGTSFAGCAVVKIDIEGGEYEVVPRLATFLRDHRPSLLLSIHGLGVGRSARSRVRSIRARWPVLAPLRGYRHRFVATRRGPWQRIDNRRAARLLISAGEASLLLTNRPFEPGCW